MFKNEQQSTFALILIKLVLADLGSKKLKLLNKLSKTDMILNAHNFSTEPHFNKICYMLRLLEIQLFKSNFPFGLTLENFTAIPAFT